MILKIGSKGDEVSKVQAILGFAKPDGKFGPNTETAVKAWQTSHNFPPDGIITDAIWAVLFPGESQQAQVRETAFQLDKLRGHIPDVVINQIPVTAEKFGITNVLRLAHFLSQCGHESAGFTAVLENLNYSAERLKVKFAKYFPNNDYEAYARNPVKIGCRVYANRNGNGDEASGEGYKYRGRGYIQLTGKRNYTSFAAFIGEDTVNNPDLVATKYPLASAAFYFSDNRIWTVCDKGSSDAVVTTVTKMVNGGINGLPDRIKHFNEYYNLLK
jgi:putative chitinase